MWKMLKYNAVADIAGGVEGGDTPSGDTPGGESPTPQGAEGQAGGQGGEEQVPFHNHPRWIAVQNAKKEAEAKAQELEGKLKGLDGAAAVHQMLQQNPENAKLLAHILAGGNPEEFFARGKDQGPEEDPYKDYDPDVAAKFREMDELKSRMAEKERQEEEAKQRTAQENQQICDSHFDGWMKEQGYVDDKGQDKDPIMSNLITSSVRAGMADLCKDPKNPTKAELDEVLGWVTKSIDHIRQTETRTVLKDASRQEVPPTGSGHGAPPKGKTTQSEADRINDIVSSF